jgi:hypothetical protein
MKLSNETLTVLKNFASINQNLEFKKGSKLTTVSPTKTVLAEAILKDDFTDEFCVEDLNEFLSVHSLFSDKAELAFDEHNILFKGDRRKIKYRKTSKNVIVTPPDKTLTLPSEDVKFTLAAEDYDWILKTSKVLSSPHIAIKSDGEKVEIVTFDAAVDTAHINSLELNINGTGNKYKIVFSVDNFKLIPGTYDVTVSFKGLTNFKNTKDNIQYWIASEAKHSKIGE